MSGMSSELRILIMACQASNYECNFANVTLRIVENIPHYDYGVRKCAAKGRFDLYLSAAGLIFSRGPLWDSIHGSSDGNQATFAHLLENHRSGTG